MQYSQMRADTLVVLTEPPLGRVMTGRVAAVTGGDGAIGSAIGRALAGAGHTVVSLDRRGEVAVDLADAGDVRAAAQTLLHRHEHCDVLVHAAAAFDRSGLGDLDLATWRHVQAVNVESALWLTQALTPGMATAGFGRIVFVVSDTIWDPPADDLLPYIASKAALVGVARSLARSLGAAGITVNCVAPGLTRTPAALAGTPAGAFDEVRARQAIDRTLTPEDVAGAVAFLASDAAGAITGQTLCADGGLVLR